MQSNFFNTFQPQTTLLRYPLTNNNSEDLFDFIPYANLVVVSS